MHTVTEVHENVAWAITVVNGENCRSFQSLQLAILYKLSRTKSLPVPDTTSMSKIKRPAAVLGSGLACLVPRGTRKSCISRTAGCLLAANYRVVVCKNEYSQSLLWCVILASTGVFELQAREISSRSTNEGFCNIWRRQASIDFGTLAETCTGFVQPSGWLAEYSHNIKFWRDDAFAILSSLGDLFMLGLLASNAKEESMAPLQYRLTLTTYFFVIWMSRATLVMTLVRICLQSPALRKQAIFFIAFTFSLVIAAILYTVVSILFCKTRNKSCSDFKLCFCRLPLETTVSAVIADFIVDTCAVYTSRALIYGDKDNDPPNSMRHLSRKRFLMMGFSSSIFTLAMNSAFWMTYFLAAPDSYFLFSSMANAVAAICILSFNIPLIAGVLLEVIYPPSQDFASFLDVTLTVISDHTITDFTSRNGHVAPT
ncbi:hypothetical protein HYPSUDRAFT_56733 [Hypholoma sublateritium FD-334 SS-4]|uniref:Uncharacterized protein n=1 Tax=Hypholoma sublateritium (strain FD-334 SS-4) TaxID=945553 RepID=A0A0D2KXC6_HYPSF|nr:hypothetical protein HYPSUDRAFT_56733 [Hypholoma sublateritium FD-334 SS-4]